jgi:hypothetical protein
MVGIQRVPLWDPKTSCGGRLVFLLLLSWARSSSDGDG